MTLVVQDDNGNAAGANGYLSVADFKLYHDARANPYSSFNDTAIAAAIVRATDYLDTRFRFVGERRNSPDIQSTQWPRNGAYDQDRRMITGVPREVKEATAEYALRALSSPINPDPARDVTGAAVAERSESVGPISESVKFVGGATFVLPKYPAADNKLRMAGLLRNAGSLLRG